MKSFSDSFSVCIPLQIDVNPQLLMVKVVYGRVSRVYVIIRKIDCFFIFEYSKIL